MTPPTNVMIEPISKQPNETMREAVENRTSRDACKGCHMMINPRGFAFEHLDDEGRFRTQYNNGKPVDASGDVFGEPFANAAELIGQLVDRKEIYNCYARQWVRFLLGTSEASLGVGEVFGDRFFQNSGDIRQLIIDIVGHDVFLTRKLPEPN